MEVIIGATLKGRDHSPSGFSKNKVESLNQEVEGIKPQQWK
jgi:hypothetical protein